MRFTLVYSGPLSASGNKPKTKEAMEIRRQLSKQLYVLWKTHPSLKTLVDEAWIDPIQPSHGFSQMGPTISMGGKDLTPRQKAEMYKGRMINLVAPVDVGGRHYFPLVRQSLYLNCELDILFLRQEDPGALISQGGDLDNRIKTLLDALRVPSREEQDVAPPSEEDLCCLMESDTLVASLNVDTDRLLFPHTEKPNEVHLVIGVSTRVLHVNKTNVCLL